uniref:LTD domain-containing protein n=1 Tax=candidate division WOR-3 bacterium TaxID=2052148 RepID=A0A7V3PTR9_UNCW3
MNCLLLAVILAARVVITEVMANPRGADGAHYPEDRNEFIELYNAGREAIDLYVYKISDGDAEDVIRAWRDSTILIKHPNIIIGTTWLKPGGYAVILDPEYTDSEALGGFVQPYRFGDSTLILTVGNTTIGNGLSVNDPIIISGYEDSSSFGTPFDDDGFPSNPGDGYSWEKIDILGPDIVANWAVCPETSGCTPGRANAVGTRIDVAVAGLELMDTMPQEPGELFQVRVKIENRSYVNSPAGTIRAWFSPEEIIAEAALPAMTPKSETVFVFAGRVLPVAGELWVKVEVPQDQDTNNNRARLMVYPRSSNRLLYPQLNCFSPDGDGFEDSLPIRYELPKNGGRLTIRVFNLSGRQIKTLLDRQIPVEVQGQVYWNGRDDQDKILPTGIYALVLDYRLKSDRFKAKVPVVLIRKKG